MDGSGRPPWRPARHVAALLAFALSVALPAAAQTVSASLQGTVRGADGAPLADAVITARHAATGLVRTALTGTDGRYLVGSLPPGEWIVTATSPEGNPGGERAVTLALQQAGRVDFVVLSGLAEQVDVKGTPALLEPKRTSTELRIDDMKVDALPVQGRAITQLALLDSSIVATPPGAFFGERGAVFSANGQGGRANAYLVDGLDNGDRVSSTTLNSFFSQQVVREYVLMKNSFAPEFGRASGGVMNVVTERGENDFAASAFVQGSRREFNSAGDFVEGLPGATPDDSGEMGAFGFKLGGPLARDRAFYFAAFEQQTTDDVYPYTGVDRNGVAGGVLRGANRDTNLFLRTDFNLSEGDVLMVRLSGDKRSSEGLNVGGIATPEAGFALEEEDWQLAAALTSVLSPTVVNEFRALVGTSDYGQRANSTRPGVERPSGIFGGNNLALQDRTEQRVELLDNVAWTVGTHQLKAGIDLLWTRTRAQTAFNPNGNFLYATDRPFEPGDCGDLLASEVPRCPPGDPYCAELATPVPCPGIPGFDDDGDGLVDEPGRIDSYPFVFQYIDGRPDVTLDDTQLALFVQDSWQVHPRLTLDYGLRYDLASYVLPGAITVPSTIDNGGAGRDTNNLAPRAAFSWLATPDGKTIVRGGAGVFYDKIPLGFPAVSAVTSQTEIGLIFPQGLTFEITEDVVEQYGIDLILSGLVFPDNLTMRFSTATELDTPYAVQYTLGADRALGQYGALTMEAVRVLGYHQVMMRDLNPVVTTDASGMPIHRDPAVGSIAAITTEGRTWYSGVTLGYRWSRGSDWASASYTWSKAEDMAPDPLKGGIALPPDSDDIEGETGRSDYDRRHRLVLSGSCGLGFWGLRVGAAAQYASATPFNVTTGRDENLDGITSDRPEGVGRNQGEDSPLGPINELRREAGLEPVDELTTEPFLQVDLRLSQPFPLGDGGAGGEWYLQVFNLFDRFNPAMIDGRVTSVNFGEALGLAGPPRTLELGLRFGF